MVNRLGGCMDWCRYLDRPFAIYTKAFDRPAQCDLIASDSGSMYSRVLLKRRMWEFTFCSSYAAEPCAIAEPLLGQMNNLRMTQHVSAAMISPSHMTCRSEVNEAKSPSFCLREGMVPLLATFASRVLFTFHLPYSHIRFSSSDHDNSMSNEHGLGRAC